MTVHCPVLIVGGGIAGMSTAVGLAQHGLAAIVVEHGDDGGERIGESLPPTARPLLSALGVLENMAGDGQLPCYGNRSSWGSDRLDEHDFIRSPYGHGWHIHRRQFERRLAERARSLGVERLTRTRIGDVVQDGSYWRITLQTPHSTRELDTKFVVDATGRIAWFARRRGARRVRSDSMVSVAAFLEAPRAPDPDSFTLVEAVEDGWWYSATIPDARLAAAFMTDSSQLDAAAARTATGWDALLARSRHTRERVARSDYRLHSPAMITDAGGGRLEPIVGERWLAVGDAAAFFDPLSSHGIVNAIAGGLGAANAIASHCCGAVETLDEYASNIKSAFEVYREQRRLYYAMERRWPTSPFWLKRRG